MVNRVMSGKGFGVRAIQLGTVAIALPMLFVLRMEEKISAEAVGTLVGAALGYLLSNIGSYDKPRAGAADG